MKLILHTGSPKTGTTSLQIAFAQNDAALLKHGVVYPEGYRSERARLGLMTSGNGVHLANYIRPHLPHEIDDKDGYLDVFRDLLRNNTHKTVFLSSEFLALPAGDRLDRVREVISEFGYVVEIVYLVRDFVPMAWSNYAHNVVKHGEQRTFVEFLQDFDPGYELRLVQAIEAFGPDCLNVRNYCDWKDDIIGHFFAEILGAPDVSVSRIEANTALSLAGVESIRRINCAGRGRVSLPEVVSEIRLLTSGGPMVPELSDSLNDRLQSRFSEQAKFVNRYVRGTPVSVLGSYRSLAHITV